MLLAPAWLRMLVAGVAVAALWAAVLVVAPSTPSIAPDRAAVRPAATAAAPEAGTTGPLRVVVRSGAGAPDGGGFDRFAAPSKVSLAPINARLQVAFYASVLHARAREGIFLADGGRIGKVAAFGDEAPGGGTFASFGDHPLPVLNAAGHVAFLAHIAGGRATEGLFFAGQDGLRAVALAGEQAPGVPQGTLIGFNSPALNDNDEIAFVATVLTGRETLDVLYLWNGRRLQKVVAERDLLTRIGGTLEAIGEPALNNSGVIAFPAAILKGPALGGIFVAGARPLALLVRAGDVTPGGAMIQRFSEHVAIDDADGITFGAFVGSGIALKAAVLRVGSAGLSEIAMEGAPAPGGGRYAGFGPWPTTAPDGAVAFIAAIDGAAGPLGVFAGHEGAVQRVAFVGEVLPEGGGIGPFPLNAAAAIGPSGAVTFPVLAAEPGGQDAILCRCGPGAR